MPLLNFHALVLSATFSKILSGLSNSLDPDNDRQQTTKVADSKERVKVTKYMQIRGMFQKF